VLEEGEIRRLGARESRKIDVRVLAATGRPMEQAVERGEFRSDLYYRLNVVRLHIPPLRERPEDIPELLTHFARQVAQRLGHPVSVTPAALAALTHHNWPGNVRELRNAVERAAVLSAGGLLDCKDFSLANGAPASQSGATSGALDLKTQVEAVERAAIQRALEASNGNRRQAANLLGISWRNSLRSRATQCRVLSPAPSLLALPQAPPLVWPSLICGSIDSMTRHHRS
jgi:DNA-binding NtrC family response regulator